MSDETPKTVRAVFTLPDGRQLNSALMLWDGIEEHPIAQKEEVKLWLASAAEGLVVFWRDPKRFESAAKCAAPEHTAPSPDGVLLDVNELVGVNEGLQRDLAAATARVAELEATVEALRAEPSRAYRAAQDIAIADANARADAAEQKLERKLKKSVYGARLAAWESSTAPAPTERVKAERKVL